MCLWISTHDFTRIILVSSCRRPVARCWSNNFFCSSSNHSSSLSRPLTMMLLVTVVAIKKIIHQLYAYSRFSAATGHWSGVLISRVLICCYRFAHFFICLLPSEEFRLNTRRRWINSPMDIVSYLLVVHLSVLRSRGDDSVINNSLAADGCDGSTNQNHSIVHQFQLTRQRLTSDGTKDGILQVGMDRNLKEPSADLYNYIRDKFEAFFS